MKYPIKLLSCLGVSLISLQLPARSDFTHTPGKSSVIVLQGEVTVDGQQRPDLGRSFADTITGGLLKTRAYSVLDHLGNQSLEQTIENNGSLAPEQSVVALGKEIGARWIFVPRMIVEGDFQKLTLKKIRVSDGQVVEVFETHSTGDRSTMFLLVGEALKDLYKQAAREPERLGKTSTGEPLPEPAPGELDPAPITIPGSYPPAPRPRKEGAAPATPKSPRQIPATEVASADSKRLPVDLGLDEGAGDSAAPRGSKPAEKPATGSATDPAPGDSPAAAPAQIKDPAVETEDKFARYMGTISTVNQDWRFCILKLRTNKELSAGDFLSVKTGTIVPDEATLEITKIEGNQAVADLVDDADLDSIKVGQAFYQWVDK